MMVLGLIVLLQINIGSDAVIERKEPNHIESCQNQDNECTEDGQNFANGYKLDDNDPASDQTTQKPLEIKVHSLENTINSLQLELQHLKDVILRKESSTEQVNLNFERSHKFSSYQSVPFLNYQDRKRILITGGAGFLGSHLTDRLMLQGHEVIVADNFFTGRKRSVEHWIGHPNFELLNHDMINPLFIEVDEIYHLASPASPPHYMFNPVKTNCDNMQKSCPER